MNEKWLEENKGGFIIFYLAFQIFYQIILYL